MAKNEQKRAKKVKKRAANIEVYVCSKCDYNTSRHSNYVRHIETKKHLEKHGKVLKSVKSVKNGKSGKNFYCEVCDYSASQKSHYDKHIRTKKHLIKMSNILDNNININTKKMGGNINSENGSSMSDIFSNDNSEMADLKRQINVILENQHIIKKETNTIKKMKSKQNIIYNNNISVNFFLDQYCANAQPIQGFINNITFKLGDIMKNNELVDNFVSKKLLKGLEDLPVTERPIHCMDQKMKNFLVKDERDGWIEDAAMNNNSTLYTKVDQLHKKAYIDFYNEYDKENPLPHDGEKEQVKFNISSQIIKQNDDTNKTIIKDIAKTVDIYDALDGIETIEDK
jgi:hypothetical protein